MTLAFATACFAEPPDVGASGASNESESGSASESTADATSGTSADESSTVSGSSGPCVPDDPECVAPRGTIWEVLLGGEGHDAAYTLIVDEGGDIIIAGEQAGDPWFARLDADGNETWSSPSPLGEGSDYIRGLALPGAGMVLGAGSQQLPSGSDGYLEIRDSTGATLGSTTYAGLGEDYLISALLQGGFVYSVGFMQIEATAEPTPLLVRHAFEGLGLDYSTVDTGVLDGRDGQLFDIALTPNGNLLVVGATRGGDGTYDASVQLFTAGGDPVMDPLTFGGPRHDDFYTVDIDASGSGIAVGRSTDDAGSEIYMMHFTVEGNTVSSQWEYAWTEAPFSYANGFTRDGDTVYIAAGTTTDPAAAEAYDARILRWDGQAEEPTWIVPFAEDAPFRDYAMDLELAPDGTLVACGVYSPDATNEGNAWVRKLAR